LNKPEPFCFPGFYTPFAWVIEKGENATHDFIHFSDETNLVDLEDAIELTFWLTEAIDWMQSRKDKK